jgi:hypothetical protein
LDTANRHFNTVLPLKLGSKVLGGNTSPRATVGVQLAALLVLTEDDSDPPEHTGEKNRVEEVGNGLFCRHQKIAHQTAGSEGLTWRTRLARKAQSKTPSASRYLKDLRLAPGVFLFG